VMLVAARMALESIDAVPLHFVVFNPGFLRRHVGRPTLGTALVLHRLLDRLDGHAPSGATAELERLHCGDSPPAERAPECAALATMNRDEPDAEAARATAIAAAKRLFGMP